MMEYQFIQYERSGNVVILRLNRPEALNALNSALITELSHAVDRIAVEDVRAVMLTGAGRAFSCGGDLAANRPDRYDMAVPLQVLWNPLIEKLMWLPMPLITALNGPVAGAACALALCGDFVIIEKSAYFLLAFSKIGLVPDAGVTWLIRNLVGRQRATEIMMLSEKISSEQAEAWGMVYRVVNDGTSAEAAAEMAARLANGPTRAYGLLRNLIRDAGSVTLSQALAAERDAQSIAGHSVDFQEGVSAFMEKRSPRFVGR